MRGTIKAAGALFVGLGMVVLMFTIGTWFMSLSSSAPSESAGAGLLLIAGGVLTGASFALFGGTAWLLASIDQRIEAFEGVWLAERIRARSAERVESGDVDIPASEIIPASVEPPPTPEVKRREDRAWRIALIALGAVLAVFGVVAVISIVLRPKPADAPPEPATVAVSSAPQAASLHRPHRHRH